MTSQTRLSKQDVIKAVELIRSGLKFDLIAEQFNVSSAAIKYHARKIGYCRNRSTKLPDGRRYVRVFHKQADRIMEMVRSNQKAIVIATVCNCSLSTVSKYRKKAGN